MILLSQEVIVGCSLGRVSIREASVLIRGTTSHLSGSLLEVLMQRYSSRRLGQSLVRVGCSELGSH